jgi:hypothetical protein
MSTEDHTLEGLLEAIDRGAQTPDDADAAVGSILARLGIDGSRPVPQMPTPPPSARSFHGPSWSLAAMLLLGMVLGVAAAVLALRPAPTTSPGELAARGAGTTTIEDPAEAPDRPEPHGGWIEVSVEADAADQALVPEGDAGGPEGEADEPAIEASSDGPPAEATESRPSPAVPSLHRREASTAPTVRVDRTERLALIERHPATAAPGRSATAGSIEGLLRHGDAGMTIRGSIAVLRNGLLTFVRTEDIQPTVDRIRFATVDATAVPVGTVFTAAAARATGALSVQEGRVFLVMSDGRPLAEVRAGEAVAVVHDPTEGVFVIYLDGMSLDAVAAAVPAGSDADPNRVRDLVAELRLAPVSGQALQTLLEFGMEDLE